MRKNIFVLLLFATLLSFGQNKDSKEQRQSELEQRKNIEKIRDDIAENLKIEIKEYNSKKLDELNSAEIGSSIIVSGYEKWIKALEVISCPEFRIGMIKYPIKVGDKLPYFEKKGKKWIKFGSTIETYGLPYGWVGVAFNAETQSYIPYLDAGTGFITKKPKKGNIEVSKTTIVDKNCEKCFKKELIYNGKEGDNVKFTYREFINNMIRPAFNQDLSYNLNDGKIIGFKGLRIEIIKTSNIGIEYKVQKHFD